MGKISQGVLGGFSGKVGNVVGGTWKGIDYMRIKPASVANPRTQGQLDQRSKFSTVLRFLQPMTDFIRVGYKLYANKMTQFNSAMSFVLNNAVTGTYPNFMIDYANALVTRGNLTGALNPTANSTNAAEVDFSWTDNTGNGSATANDKALLLVLNPSKGEAVFDVAGNIRSSTAQTITVPSNYTGDSVEVYIGFISDDGSAVSNSSYLGTVTVA